MKNITNITLGNNDSIVEVLVRKSKLAKRVMIKFSQKKGFELIIPTRVSVKNAVAFLYKKEDWVLEKNAILKEKTLKNFCDGSQIPIAGVIHTINHSGNLRGITRIEGDRLIISGLEGHISRKTRQFLIKLAKEKITSHCHKYAKTLGVHFNKISVRDTATRWGSCSHSNNLSFSWRLVMAPDRVLQYVVAHELAHLIEMNHSKKFWHVVASICPDYKQERSWLKDNGGALHGYI
jgi:hypothetical protein